MLHIYLFDDIKFTQLEGEEYALLSSVNTTNDVKEKEEKPAPLHRLIRYDEFVCFDRKLKHLVNKTPELHLKYGGICFLYTGELDRYEFVKKHCEYIFKFKYDIDPLGNDINFDKSSPAAAADKIMLRLIFKYKDISVLAYRPTKKFLEMSIDEIKKIAKKITPDTIKNSDLFYKRYKI